MAYAALLTARDNAASLGNSLASADQYLQDDTNSNNQQMEFYKSLLQQRASAGIGDLAPGALILGQSAIGLYNRIGAAKELISKLPEKLGNIVDQTAAKLSARAVEGQDIYNKATDLVSGTADKVTQQYKTLYDESKSIMAGGKLKLGQAANLEGLHSDVMATKADLSGRLQQATDLLDKHTEQYSKLSSELKGQLAETQGKIDGVLKGSSPESLRGFAKQQYDDLSSKLPDLQSKIDNAETFVSKTIEKRGQLVDKTNTALDRVQKNATDQFNTLSSKLSPEELQNTMQKFTGKIATTVPEVSAQIEGSVKNTANKMVSDFTNTATEFKNAAYKGNSSVAESASYLEEPKFVSAFGGFKESTPFADVFSKNPTKEVTSLFENKLPSFTAKTSFEGAASGALGTKVPVMLSEGGSALKGAVSAGFETLGNVGGIAGGVSAIQGLEKGGPLNVGEAANAFFGIQGAKGLAGQVTGALKGGASDITTQASGAAEAAVGGIGKIVNTAGETAKNVVTTLSSTAQEGQSVLSTGFDVAKQTLSEGLAAGKDLIGGALKTAAGAASDVAEGVGLGLAEAIPVVGEVAGIGLAGYQIYEGFKDLFNHPSAPKINAPASVANIAQSYQSGV